MEQTWRYSKSELAYAFLLSLLDEAAAPVRAWRLSLLVPTDRQAEPNDLDSALSPAHGPGPLMARLPPGPSKLAAPKFGMAHVSGTKCKFSLYLT